MNGVGVSEDISVCWSIGELCVGYVDIGLLEHSERVGQGIFRVSGHSNQQVGVLGVSVDIKLSRAPCKQMG